jgi:hypothetical protein
MATEQSFRCPTCGYEYQSWVKVCPDCGSPIESRPALEVIKGKLEPDKDPRWTIVTNVPNAIIGSFIKSQLEDAGIPVLMFRSRSVDIAEFSHNDFVPQDLLVPMHQVRDARRLIDSAPGDDYGPSPWDPESFEDEDSDVDDPRDLPYDGETQAPAAALPEGWEMLPSEADLDARQQVRRSHGAVLRGWYWSDGRPTAVGGETQSSDESGDLDGNDDEYDDYDSYPPPDRISAYRRSTSEGDWPRNNNWVKVVYGVLLMVMSLPFLIQLVQHLFSVFR